MKKLLYVLFVLMAVFTISSMNVVFKQYYDTAVYSPWSTIMIMALTFGGILALFAFDINAPYRTTLNKLVTLLWLFSLVMLVISMETTLSTKNPMKIFLNVSLWESAYFLFYCFAHKEKMTQRYSTIFFTLLFIPVTVFFLRSNNMRMALQLSMAEMGNNMVFFVVLLLPWLLLLKKRWLRTIAVLAVTVMSLVSLKRSALIILTTIDIIFFYLEYLSASKKRMKYTLYGIVFLAAAVLLMSYFNKQTGSLATARMENLSDDEGSGRLERWQDVWNLFSTEESTARVFFGHGYRTVELFMGNEHQSAHNDFLEVLFDYGVVGFVLYVLIHLCLIKRCIQLFRNKSPIRVSYMVSYLLFFGFSIVSHLIIYPTYFIFLVAYWAVAEANEFEKKKNIQALEQ